MNLILKNLYETNFFKQVNLNIENSILKIKVLENPIIEDIEINGLDNKEFEKELLSVLTLSNRKPYVESMHLNDINYIKNFSKASGFYFAKIKTSQINNDIQNTVQLIYDIDLGDKAKISKIVFLGDKKIKDKKDLEKIIRLKKINFGNLFQIKYISSQPFELDKRLLVNYYKNNGYYFVKIENSFVEFQDKNSFKLVFKIELKKFLYKAVHDNHLRKAF